jgi:hypothetical protein
MGTPDKTELKDLIVMRLLGLANSTNDQTALRALQQLSEVSGLMADVHPKTVQALQATQHNTFVLGPDQMNSMLAGLRALSSAPVTTGNKEDESKYD